MEKWFLKATAHGNANAQKALAELNPINKRFCSAAVICEKLFIPGRVVHSLIEAIADRSTISSITIRRLCQLCKLSR